MGSSVQTTFLVLSVYLGLSFGALRYFRQRVSPAVLLLGCQVVSQFVLTEAKFGPASPRVYFAALTLMLALAELGKPGRHLITISRAKALLLPWLALIIWLTICDVSRARNQSDLTHCLDYLLSSRLVPLAMFLSVAVLVKSEVDAIVLAVTMTGVTIASAFVCVLQYFNVQWALSLHETFYTGFLRDAEEDGLELSGLYVSGLARYSIEYVYELLLWVPLSLAYLIVRPPRNTVATWLIGLSCALCAVTLYLAKSRSGLVGIPITIAVLLSFSGRGNAITLRRRAPSFAILAFVLIAVAGFGVTYAGNRISTRYRSFDRMQSFADEGRMATLGRVVREVRDSPIMGIGLSQYQRKYVFSPHNTVLNSMVIGGVPGVTLCVWIYCALWKLLRSTWTIPLGSHASWIAVGTAAGVVNYIWNGMTHNASFISGGAQFFDTMALNLCCCTLIQCQGWRVGGVRMTHFNGSRISGR